MHIGGVGLRREDETTVECCGMVGGDEREAVEVSETQQDSHERGNVQAEPHFAAVTRT